MKRKPESNAKRSETMKRVWAERKAKAEHDAIHSVVPRCKRPLRDKIWHEIKEWLGGDT